ncbi:hypothetical protein AN958_12554 [Leucoagaricus sp. SymC.cos]|nr:hypothetical protein AN958_12554 [Leucoagaricus sp. SymC.cos]
MTVDIDLRNALCLACFSSLLSEKQVAHITQCCKQVICESCIRANPRLATYEPCLVCLGGVGASQGTSQSQEVLPKPSNSAKTNPYLANETMFVLGDDSDEDAEEQDPNSDKPASSSPSPQPPAYQEVVDPPTDIGGLQPLPVMPSPHEPDATPSLTPNTPVLSSVASQKYYINPSDTIHGIALRFGMDARDLCRVNRLPFSTLSTTPHLLHTRVFLTLPPSSKPIPLQYALSEEDQATRNAQRAKERAEKRLQMVTKEVDWRVAKSYVALADNPECEEDMASMCKERPDMKVPISNHAAGPSLVESRAVDMYLEDEEWEQNELNAGRSPNVPRFPLPSQTATSVLSSGIKAKWWPWNRDE